jgi:hypothetical protein
MENHLNRKSFEQKVEIVRMLMSLIGFGLFSIVWGCFDESENQIDDIGNFSSIAEFFKDKDDELYTWIGQLNIPLTQLESFQQLPNHSLWFNILPLTRFSTPSPHAIHQHQHHYQREVSLNSKNNFRQ